MKSIGDTARLLFHSLVGSDCIIFIVAIVTLVCFAVIIVLKKQLKDEIKTGDERIISTTMKRTAVAYNLYTTLISLFPLLGMLGTVFGLLGLDLAAGDMENIKNNFFIALTSTAWGIIFSIIYKVLNACIVEDVENQIEIAKEMIVENK